MIRESALYLVMLFLLGYAWRDWYKALCGLILLMIVMEHPDMPKSIAGIPGFNPFNILLANNVLAWLASRRREQLHWDMPLLIQAMLGAYVALILVGWWRAVFDLPAYLSVLGIDRMSLIQEELLNTIKWIVPGLMLFDGCRSEERFRLGMGSTIAIYLGLALLTIKTMPLTALALGGDQLQHLALRVLNANVGYHRVNLSVMFAGASWAFVCARGLLPGRGPRAAMLGAAVIILYGQALTAGRAGYMAWALIGLLLSVTKYRKQLLVLPVIVVLVLWLAPGITERLMTGISSDSSGDVKVDEATLTADRALIWPMVLGLIQASPVVGWGRLGLMRSGVSLRYYEMYGEFFQHPHNAYLELLVDNGAVGAVIVVPFYLMIAWVSFRLFLKKQSATCVAAGGVALTLTLALLIGGLSSQTFYPREGAIGMWCAIGLMLRVHVQQRRSKRATSHVAKAADSLNLRLAARHARTVAAASSASAHSFAGAPAVSRHARALRHQTAGRAPAVSSDQRPPSRWDAWLQPGRNIEFWAA